MTIDSAFWKLGHNYAPLFEAGEEFEEYYAYLSKNKASRKDQADGRGASGPKLEEREDASCSFLAADNLEQSWLSDVDTKARAVSTVARRSLAESEHSELLDVGAEIEEYYAVLPAMKASHEDEANGRGSSGSSLEKREEASCGSLAADALEHSSLSGADTEARTVSTPARRNWTESERRELLTIVRACPHSYRWIDITAQFNLGKPLERQRNWMQCASQWRNVVNPEKDRSIFTDDELFALFKSLRVSKDCVFKKAKAILNELIMVGSNETWKALTAKGGIFENLTAHYLKSEFMIFMNFWKKNPKLILDEAISNRDKSRRKVQSGDCLFISQSILSKVRRVLRSSEEAPSLKRARLKV